MNVREKVLIPCQTTMEVVKKEDNDSNRGIIVRGKLITCGVPTRNGISYTQKSMERFVREFKALNRTLPHLDSHDDSSIRRTPPFGHITKVFMDGNDVFYESDVDPEEEVYLRKVKRGDIKEVSLQAIVDVVDDVQEANGENTLIADIREILEISSVLIPGARDTSMEIQENLVSEKRFVEAFRHSQKHNFTFKESLRITREAKDNNELAGGQIEKEPKEDLSTDNGDALIGIELPKKIKKVPEFLVQKSKYLKIISRRF